MKAISKMLILLVLLFCTKTVYSQCETYLQRAETLFAQKKYEEAKRQYLSYKECKPNTEGINEKIAKCDYLAIFTKSINIGVCSFTGYHSKKNNEESQVVKYLNSDRRFIVYTVTYWRDYWARRDNRQSINELDYVVKGKVILKEPEKTAIDKKKVKAI